MADKRGHGWHKRPFQRNSITSVERERKREREREGGGVGKEGGHIIENRKKEKGREERWRRTEENLHNKVITGDITGDITEANNE